MRERPTARVLLIDAAGRILLMKGRFPTDPGGPGAWFTLGGGVEPGETVAGAAAREVREETGFADVEIGPAIFEREARYQDLDGAPLLFKETYFVARCAGGEVSREGWQPLEQRFVDDIRWWSLSDLAVCPDLVVPDCLLTLFEAALRASRATGATF